MKKNYGICPRCHRKISWIEKLRRGDRTYIIAVHYLGSFVRGGKRKKIVEKCYLGPEGEYEYVSLTHSREGLALKGMWDRERAIDYLEHLAKFFRENIDKLDKIDRERIHKIIKEIENVISPDKAISE